MFYKIYDGVYQVYVGNESNWTVLSSGTVWYCISDKERMNVIRSAVDHIRKVTRRGTEYRVEKGEVRIDMYGDFGLHTMFRQNVKECVDFYWKDPIDCSSL